MTSLTITHIEPETEQLETKITLPDRFDIHQVPAFQARLLGAPGPIVLDLGDVRFLDQEGLRAIVRARATAIDEGHDLAVDRISTSARITLELTGLGEALPARHPRSVDLAEVS